MAKVPPHLRRWIQRDEMPSRKVWRGWQSFRLREKRKEFLSVAWCMQMAGALEEYGATPKEIEARSQRLMASMLGIDVSTFNRRLGQFSAPDGRWDDERRRRHSEKMKAAAAARKVSDGAATPPLTSSGESAGVIQGAPAPLFNDVAGNAGAGVASATDSLSAGKQHGAGLKGQKPAPCHSRSMRTVRRLATLFTKSAQFGQAQLYGLATNQRPQIVEGRASNDAVLLARVFGENLFDPECRGAKGFKSVPGWIWSPELPDVEKCSCQSGQLGLHPGPCRHCEGAGVIYKRDPLPDYGRVLMTFLLLKGLEQHGSVIISQEEIADALGMDVNTVAKYEDKWEALMVIRCITGEVHRDASGAVVRRDPHKIIWLPDRLLDEDLVQREWQRLQALRKQVRDAVAFQVAERVQGALLKEWQGKEHSLRAFWNEMRRRLAAENVKQVVLDTLFPFSRE